jgi:hypothetical protein
MHAIDSNIERIWVALDDIRAEMRGMRADWAATQDRLVQIGFGLAFSLIAAVIGLVIALAT